MAGKMKTYEDLELEIEDLKKQLLEKKDIEKELSKTRILMQAAFDQSPVPLVVVTYPDFTFKIINKATEDFMLIPSTDYLNKTPMDAPWNWKEYYPDHTPVTLQEDLPMPLAMHGITTKNKEMYIVRHDGSIVWELVSASPIYDNEGELLGGILAITDITERKKAEKRLTENEIKLKEQNEEYETLNEELRETNEQLEIAKNKAEESDKLKTAFLQNMSHEIRTPMNAIIGFSGLLLEYSDDKESIEEFTKIITQRCNDLLEIINDILDISKIESGQLTVNMEACNLDELISELSTFFEEYQARLDKKHIAFSLQAQCASPNNLIITDIVKLKQIFINLINNAFKFTEEGKIEGGCRLDANNKLVFYVSDTGIGIPADKRNQIFERFTQLHAGSIRNYGGTGLGLSIVKALTNLLGGEIFVESELGKGSKFSFTIPYKLSNSGQKKSVDSSLSDDGEISSKTILIVEDDYFNAEYLKVLVSKIGFKIIQANCGEDAVIITQSQTIDLVLMDIRLPGIDGYEAIRQMRITKPKLKIIAQTAYAAQDERQKALDIGCVDYISKPTKRDLLLSLIKKHLH